MNQYQDPLAAEPQVPQGRLEQATGFNPWELAGITAATLGAGYAGKRLYNKTRGAIDGVADTAKNIGAAINEVPGIGPVVQALETARAAPGKALKNANQNGAVLRERQEAARLANAAQLAEENRRLVQAGLIRNLRQNPEVLSQYAANPIATSGGTLSPENLAYVLKALATDANPTGVVKGAVRKGFDKDAETVKLLRGSKNLTSQEQNLVNSYFDKMPTALSTEDRIIANRFLNHAMKSGYKTNKGKTLLQNKDDVGAIISPFLAMLQHG
jgi:hypothetical protein